MARAFTELRMTFAGASLVPDVTVYRRERVPVDADGWVADDFCEAPDITVEITLPDESVDDLARRCVWYVENGVSIALVVDPRDDSVLAFRPEQHPQAWRGTDRIDVHEVLPDFRLTVEELLTSLRLP